MRVNWFVVRYFAVFLPIGFVVALVLAFAFAVIFADVMTAISGSPYVVPPVCR